MGPIGGIGFDLNTLIHINTTLEETRKETKTCPTFPKYKMVETFLWIKITRIGDIWLLVFRFLKNIHLPSQGCYHMSCG